MAPHVALEVNEPSGVAAARRMVARLVADRDPDLAEAVRLTVSELLTNAIVHGRPPVGLLARVEGQILRIEVSDNSAARGSPQQASGTASSGRGLAIVDAVAHRWGMEARGTGKAVWLEFYLAAVAGPEECVVHLLGVPVDAYLRSQEQLEDTLHELQVLAASDRAAFGALEAATVTPLRHAMEVFRGSRHQGRAQAQAAASAGHAAVDFEWKLPPEAAEAARVYGKAVAELEQLARSGVLLTPPPDPEVARLRQWLAEEIAGQLRRRRTPAPFARRQA